MGNKLKKLKKIIIKSTHVLLQEKIMCIAQKNAILLCIQ